MKSFPSTKQVLELIFCCQNSPWPFPGPEPHGHGSNTGTAAGQHWRCRWLLGACKSLWLILCLSQHWPALILPRDSGTALCLPVAMEHTSHHLPPHLARKVRLWHSCEPCSASPRSPPELLDSSELLHRLRMDRSQLGNCYFPTWHIPRPWKIPPKAQRALHNNWLTYLTHLLNCYYTCWLITSSGNQRAHKFNIDLCKPAALQMLAGSGGLSGAWGKWGIGNMALWKCPWLGLLPHPLGRWGSPRSHGEPPASQAWGASTALPAPSAFLSTD